MQKFKFEFEKVKMYNFWKFFEFERSNISDVETYKECDT